MSTTQVAPNLDADMAQGAPDATAQPSAQPDAPAAPAQAQPAAPAQPSQPAQPTGSKWANVVKGALDGLAMGGIPGAVGGAIAPTATRQAFKNAQSENNSKAQQAQANVSFTSAQAAHLQGETAYRQMQAQELPKELQLKVQAQDSKSAEDLMNRGLTPAFVTAADHPDDYRAALQSYSDNNGGVPSIVSYHMGDKIVAFNLDQMSQNPAVLSELNRSLQVQGMQPLTAAQFMNPKMLPPAVKAKLLGSNAHFMNPVPETDPDKLKTQIYQYGNYLATAKALPEDTPDKDKSVTQLSAALANLKSAPGLQGDTEKTKAAMKIAGVRGAAFNNSKIIPVIDEQGNLTVAKAGDALSRGLAPGVEGAKIGAKQAQLGDIQTGLAKVRDTVGKLQTPFTAAQVTQLNLAINGTDESTIAANIKALNNQNLSSDQKQFVVDIAQLNERALSLRNIAGQGQGSDALRAAIHRMLPGAASGDREMMTKQLDAMDQQVKVLGGGIPKVKGLPTNGTPQANSAAAPQANAAQNFTHLSASGRFGWNGTKWVPTGK